MKIAWCLLAATGCATIDDGFSLQIEARDAPVVVFRDGDGPWQELATTPDGTAYVQVHEPLYGVGALCGNAISTSAPFIFDTQPGTVFLSCPVTTAITTTLHVRGTTEPMAMVWIDGDSQRADAAGAFDLTLYEQGLHDVVAILPSTPPRIVAKRAIAFSGDTLVDLPATGATEMTALYPMVVGADPATLELSSDLNTPTDWISLGSSPNAVYVPPSTFLAPTDRPAIAARDHGCVRQHALSEANEPLVMPAPLEYSLDRTQLAWTADASVAWDSAILEVESFDSETSRYSAYASASYRALAGDAIPIVALDALPGWTPGLARLSPDKPARFSFAVSRGSYDGDHTSCGANAQLDRW